MRRSLLPLLLILVFGSGCGAIRSTVGIIEAEKALTAAHKAGAKELAPFPTTMAEELLDKAREEMGYAEYSRSYEMAKEAKELAESAALQARNNPVQPPTRMTPLKGPRVEQSPANPPDEDALPTEATPTDEAAPATEEASP